MRFKIKLRKFNVNLTFPLLEKNENEIIQSHGNLKSIWIRNAIMPLPCDNATVMFSVKLFFIIS